MKIDILTLFPEMFKGVFDHSIISRAVKNKIVKINLHNLRDWAKDNRKTVDDSPYGGGAGMVLKIDVLDRAISSFKRKTKKEKRKIILLTPQGKIFNQKKAKTLTQYSNLLLICGHYEGFDERVRKLVDEEISIGSYVLTGGEIPAMVITDTVARLLPGVLGKNESSQEESFSMNGLFINNKLQATSYKLQAILEYPQYTRPESYKPISKNFKRALAVPKILLSGNHAKIKDWRIAQSFKKSKK